MHAHGRDSMRTRTTTDVLYIRAILDRLDLGGSESIGDWGLVGGDESNKKNLPTSGAV